MPDPKTVAFYETEAEAYAKAYRREDRNHRLERFLDRLPEGGGFLDLGCGGGWAAGAAKARGFSVTALDASAEFARIASREHGVNVRVAGFDRIDWTDAFDGVWAHFSLLHETPEAFPERLRALYRAMRPDGWLFLGMEHGTGTYRDTLDRFYACYSEAELEAMLTGAGFSGIAFEHLPGTHYDGTPMDLLFVTARRDG